MKLGLIFFPKTTMILLMKSILLILFILFGTAAFTQKIDSLQIRTLKKAIGIGPMGDIFIIQFGQKISMKDELIIGASYTNPAILNVIQYPGTEEIFTLELGYRRYFWKNLHFELQFDPQYFNCRDTSENKTYKRFGLTPEIRFGYRFDFKIKTIPLFFNLQWFAGYHIINPKPKSFQDVDGGSFYISPIPMFFLGYRF